MALKLYMSKAYDRIEWEFMNKVMLKMGFGSKWVDQVMQCVTTVNYSLLINGVPRTYFAPSRGIRQGDPLSPYLFILCSEFLSYSLNQAELQGLISRVPAARGAIHVNHLFFADNSLVFCRSNPTKWGKVQHVLSNYEQASGQRLNLDKSSIFFNSNTKVETQHAILQLAGIKASGNFDKYLGLPSYVGRSKTQAFNSVLDRTKAKLASWKINMLSQAGKETLLKAVLQSIPTYSMGIFKFPKTILKRVNQLLQSFWWGRKENSSKTHWLSWQTLGKSKQKGGLGFRDFESFNLAPLAKQGWRVIQNLSSFAAQVLKAKYFANSDFLLPICRPSDSYVWKSFISARPVLKEGLMWKVGNGSKIRIWKDKWIPCLSSYQVQSPVNILEAEAVVSELIDPDSMQWDLPLLYAIFSKSEAGLISKIPISPCRSNDLLTWRCSANGKFSVRSAYHLQGSIKENKVGQTSDQTSSSSFWNKVWGIKATQATKSFLWRAATESLATNLNLFKRKMVESPLCPVCLLKPESISHALWSCNAAQDVWSMSSRRIQKLSSHARTFKEILKPILFQFLPLEVSEVAITTKAIWHRRNTWIFEQQFQSPSQVSKQVSHQLHSIKAWLEGEPKQQKSSRSPNNIWSAPPPNVFKSNWDAAIDKGKSKLGIGVAVRDLEGQIVATLCSSLDLDLDPLLDEAVAARRATSFCAELGLSDIILEGDSLAVVKVVQHREDSWSSSGVVLRDVKLLLSRTRHWSIQYVPREVNVLAHHLAKFGLTCSKECILIEDYPPCIQDSQDNPK
ncbi:uncharacterized protein LOC122278613 [Carya illinoinensis]|uniref:uncharacterized protein LOC122278613 n=1 Tax=Carya illinoinensis TaxID=32201 RepID=UPI001C726281|nr:uncharacterized protein LOC122278613 [Carya illinoinensis]